MSSSTGYNNHDVHERACDLCRFKKIKCDKQIPCANCRAHGVECLNSSVKKIRERKARVLISTQYEEKIDRISSRLAGVENSLRSIEAAVKQSTTPASSIQQIHGIISVPPASPQLNTPANEQDTATPQGTFEGQSSLSAHSIYATRFVSATAETDASFPKTDQMNTALQKLRDLVSRHNEIDVAHSEAYFPDSQCASRIVPNTLALPPLDVVKQLLRTSKDRFSPFFATCYPFLDLEKLHELLKVAYMSYDGYTLATAMQVFGGLYWLFREASAYGHSDSFGAALPEYVDSCKRNLESCINGLQLLLPVSDENVIALFIGAFHAVECSKPSLGRLLTNTAVHFAKSLGYHHAGTIRDNEERRKKTWLFWALYILDKSLALRFGTASSIQDYDLSLPLPEGDAVISPESVNWAEINTLWVRTAKVQGQIFEFLYSPHAMASSSQDRVEKIALLAQETESIRHSSQQLDLTLLKQGKSRQYARMIQQWDEVTHLCNLTLIYRAMPVDDNDNETSPGIECIKYAREAIIAHQQCFIALGDEHPDFWEGYFLWGVLSVPFTPLVVLFCSVIKTSSCEDLGLLRSFIDTLPVSQSPLVANFRRLCQVFFDVASVYLQERSSTTHGVSTQGGTIEDTSWSQFDHYLGELGFAVGTNDPMSGITQADWFQGNQNILSMLEQDLSFLDEINGHQTV